MNYAILLAGGSGTRMGNTGVPKQFLTLNDKPIIIHSLENLLRCKYVDKVIIVCHKDYLSYLHNLLVEYDLANCAEITEGGNNRLESAVNGLKHIKKRFEIHDNDVFMAHDAARMFTSQRIFDENIQKAKQYGAATTVYYLEETVVEVDNDGLICRAQPRERRYTDQSPQTYNIQRFLELLPTLSAKQMGSITDLAEVYFANGEKVFPVLGEKSNIKITTPFDLTLAKMQIDNK